MTIRANTVQRLLAAMLVLPLLSLAPLSAGPSNPTATSRTTTEADDESRQEQDLNACTSAIRFMEEADVTRPYEVIETVELWKWQGRPNLFYSFDNSLHELKIRACKLGGDAVLFPDEQAANEYEPESIKIVVWIVP